MFLFLYLFCGQASAQVTSNTPVVAASQTSTSGDTSAIAAPETHSSSPGISSSLGDTTPPADLPDAPQQQQPPLSGPVASEEGLQTKRILGIFPNFRAVSANVHLPPQSVKEKFVTASHDSFDYSSIFLPAAVAGINQATNSVPEFHQGAAGYGRYFWHTFVDQTIENYMVEFIFPVITHEDTRYYTLGHGGFVKRAGYSLSRVVITRNDAGHNTFNISEVLGSGTGAGISNLYYPQSQRTASNTITRWGTSIGIDAGTFLAHEFWPDINRKLFHGKQPSQ
ncbi:MAG TPA: hypothetical protein VH117_08360 [Edaphobacter sp.]|jgi:hypothetical protein|nr:hypothetical protein [Edaphobacter sp.]